MGNREEMIDEITGALELELLPLPGQTLSLADIQHKIGELEGQFNTLLEQAVLEAKLTTTEKEWYIRAVRQFGWSKSELLRQMEAESHLTLGQGNARLPINAFIAQKAF